MAEIRVEQVQRVFGNTTALAEINLEVQDQEFVVLLGPSGCGKTTLLRIIAGLETATSGRVFIGGRDVTNLAPRQRQIAMVFQNYAIFPHLTVFDNVAFGLRMQRAPQQLINERVERAATLMHIEPYLKRYPSQLSGGQRQRVAVARALAVEPQVLLMDEPLSNLDALLRLEMRAELKTLLQGTKTTTIYVTHDQVEAMSLADRIAVMHGGHIVQYAPPVEVYEEPANTFVGGFIGNPPMNFVRFPVHEQAGQKYAQTANAALRVPDEAGREVLMGIRPEDFSISLTATSDALPAPVRLVEHLGPHLLITASLDDQLIKINADPHLSVRTGDTLYLQPNARRTRWLDPETGFALTSPQEQLA
ncbi:ABC transporter ATP-binding protein [Deinococcus peraridilitoris]|uniref:ATPase component of ABC-type sugar transporter n=1 Tax=Deinococcus peraridilitoris (strain DSM 19664 / LMG 22246 / CIP 109416 / KR-200) TaxID=937777 RepID=L0A7A0_DEIPD|nr:ABC transporter ATP-binding protein [Deinococcus peraridilitoris]AFZ69738.1 ATPase component of ABC-type sugar transporter [Deinococcus peraridilitoris DSM 19664]